MRTTAMWPRSTIFRRSAGPASCGVAKATCAVRARRPGCRSSPPRRRRDSRFPPGCPGPGCPGRAPRGWPWRRRQGRSWRSRSRTGSCTSPRRRGSPAARAAGSRRDTPGAAACPCPRSAPCVPIPARGTASSEPRRARSSGWPPKCHGTGGKVNRIPGVQREIVPRGAFRVR